MVVWCKFMTSHKGNVICISAEINFYFDPLSCVCHLVMYIFSDVGQFAV